MPEENKRKLIELLNQYELPFIEDDIYGELAYSDQRPKTVKSYDTEDRVLLCSSVSKVLDPQLGLGWVIPGRYIEEIEYRRFLSSTSHFRLPQLAVAEVLSKGAYDRHLKLARETYHQRRNRLFDLVSLHFPEETRLSKPQGGFVAWLELPKKINTTELYLKAKQQGIIISPGTLFSSNPKKYHHSIRLSYAPEWKRDREEAIRILGVLAKDMLSSN
jgi:DNA-binding transcriptional MocR family regulator